jgi:hypothetical protein
MLKGILGSKVYQKTPFDDEFDSIEAKYRGVSKQVHFRIQIRNLDEDVVKMITI